MTISTRPELPEDDPFLQRLITDAISDQLQAGTWPQPLRDSILPLQCRMRRDAIRSAYGGRDEIIMVNGEPAGWLVAAELPGEIRLAEIMVSVEKRGMGVGTDILAGVLADGERTGKPVRLTVSLTNPGAERLYRRLGFRRIDADAVNATMEWRIGAVRHEL